MKRWMLAGLVVSLVWIAACSKTAGTGPSEHEGHGGHSNGNGASSPTEAVWSLSESKPQANANTKVSVQIRDGQGKPVEKFDLSHEKKMHLIIVSRDLSYFNHIHPEYKADGQFQIDTSFPAGGDYKLFADYVPTGGASTTKSSWVTIGGPTKATAAVTPDSKLVQTADGKEVTLTTGSLQAGKEAALTFRITDEKSKQLITDLQPYLGAVGHVVILSSDTEQYLHVHPADEKSTGPDAKFITQFPQSGVYKIWGQFQHGGRTIIVPFVVNVP